MGERRRSLQDRIRAQQSGVFIGRTEQLRQFEANLALPFDDPRQRFLYSVSGDAGIGKTFLLRQLARVARDKGWLTATVDHTALDVAGTMAAIIDQLARSGARVRRYADRYATYQARRGELAADPEAPDGLSSLLTRTAVRVGLHAAGEVPIAGALTTALDADAAADQVDRLRRFIAGRFRNTDDLRLVLSPIAELTPAFLADLTHACDQAPVALFFDTYEWTGAFLDMWLLELLEGHYGDLPENLVLTIAGQHPLDPNRWAQFYGLRADLPLRVFTDDEARDLLATRGVTDPHVVDVILTLSGRLPVLVAMLAQSRPTRAEEIGDPSGDAVERFLRWEDDDARRHAAQLAALPRSLDTDRIAAILGLATPTDTTANTATAGTATAGTSTAAPADTAAATFAWLRSLPFVSVRAEGSHQYHDVVRRPMLRQVRRDSPATWRTTHQRLAEHYRSRRAAMGLAGDSGVQDSAWQALAAEEFYHRLCAHDPDALTDATHQVIDTWHWTTPATSRRLIETIAAAGQDAAHTDATRLAAALLGPLTQDPPDPVALLTILLQEPTCGAAHRARALVDRAGALRERGDTDRELADLTRAIDLQPDYSWALASRGETYRRLARYDEALTDLTRAIDLRPDYSWAIASRGQTYRQLARHDEALTELTRAIELDPDYSWAIASRGQTYRQLGRHDEALADFTRALDLVPDYIWALASRGETHRQLGRYDEALTDLTRVIDLRPDYAWAVASRGQTYRHLARHDEALTDLTRALALDPDYTWALAHRSELLVACGRFAEAGADQRRLMDLDSQTGWSRYRYWLHFHTRDVAGDAAGAAQRALHLDLATLEHAPGNAHLSFHVAVYLCALDRPAEAEERILTTLSTDPPKKDVDNCIKDLTELHRTTGRSVARMLSILRAGY